MSVNINKLLGKIREANLTQEDLARKIGINPSTYYRKLKSQGESFTVGEMHAITRVLNLSKEEAILIFLSQYSHYCDKTEKR